MRLCTVPGCHRKWAKRGWCTTHYERWRIHGDVNVSLVPRGTPGYLAMHKQVHRKRGKATTYTCVHCGAVARQWAYDHLDQDELVGVMVVRQQEFHLRFSRDINHYIPLCVSCHVRFDHQAAAA